MASTQRSVVATILFVVLGGPGWLLVYLPWWMTRFRVAVAEPVWQMALAGALILVGLAPLFESTLRFIFVGRGTLVPAVPTERLVVTGLYRYVRNPMYLGVFTTLGGEVLLFRSRDLLTEFLICALAVHLFVLLYEEPTLARRHPAEYPLYKNSVPRWLPRLTPWSGPANPSSAQF